MDGRLLNRIKRVTNKYRNKSDDKILYALGDIKQKIEELANQLFKLKVEKITGAITYQHQYDLIKSIKALAHIVLLLMNEQDRKIRATRGALKTGNDSIYFTPQDEKEGNRIDIIENEVLNSEIDDIIMRRKNVYINSFGYFKSEEQASVIIKKEFNDVCSYLDVLLKINEIEYNNFDNYDPLINGCQTLMYELAQLAIALMKAEESRIVRTINNPNIEGLEGYFIIMDFINSRALSPDQLEELIDNINRINITFDRLENIGLLCKMRIIRQDEVQGIFIGNMDRFITILETELIHDVRLAYSKFDINDCQQGIININKAVFDNPFVLVGRAPCSARDMMDRGPILVRSRKLKSHQL